MRTVVLALPMLGVLVALPAIVCAASPVTETCERGLPKKVWGLLANEKDWAIQDLKNLDVADLELWTKSNQGRCPGVAVGHFMGGPLVDYAVLLVPRNPAKSGYKVLLFSPKGKDGDYVSMVAAQGKDEVRIRQTVWLAKPDTYSDAEENHEVHLKHDGFVVETLEASATLFYWSKGHLQQLMISE